MWFFGDFFDLIYHAKTVQEVGGYYMYLATVMDVVTREIVGVSVMANHSVSLVLQALFSAVEHHARPTIFHSGGNTARTCSRGPWPSSASSFPGARKVRRERTAIRSPSIRSSRSTSAIPAGSKPRANSSTRSTGSSGTTTTGGYTRRSRCRRNCLPNGTENSQRYCLNFGDIDNSPRRPTIKVWVKNES